MTRLLIVISALVFAFACGSSDPDTEEAASERCDTCGMLVSPEDGWRAGADELTFDAPKCLFRHAHRHGELRSPWVIEYYTQERRDAEGLLYVTGTDLESPMGADLVPVEGREAAERLLAEHGGETILAFDEVSAPLVEALFH